MTLLTPTMNRTEGSRATGQPSLGMPLLIDRLFRALGLRAATAPLAGVDGLGRPAVLVMVYVVAMPLLAGLPRGAALPLLRPSEALQLVVTGAGLAMFGIAVLNGRRWWVRLNRVEWWLLAMTAAASLVPLLWLVGRGEPVGPAEVMATFPFIKYAALYLLVRLCVRTETDVAAVAGAMLGSALIISAIAVTQAVGVGPVIDLLGQHFVSSTEDIVDGGRGTTTIGSSIATGAYLAVCTGVALSWSLAGGNRLLSAVAAVLAVGALASGQAGSVLAILVVVGVVAHHHQKIRQLLAVGLPLGGLGIVVLWPVVASRLATIDQGSGLPHSWVIRWNNISELYLPDLLAGGWLLGINPDAVVQPPDVWREAVYLESGYLWLLWVGGVPLLVAAIGFLVSTWRALATESRSATDRMVGRTDIRIAGRGAVAMVVVLSVLDPHLTLRAGADTFFVLAAIGMAGDRLAIPTMKAADRWRTIFAAEPQMTGRRYDGARVQYSEGEAPDEAEMVLSVAVKHGHDTIASTNLTLIRHGVALHAVATGPARANSEEAWGLLWRGIVAIAKSLRVSELSWPDHRYEDPIEAELADLALDGWRSARRTELKIAARLAERLEVERLGREHRFTRRVANLGSAPSPVGVTTKENLPAVRLDFGLQLPRWKRAADLLLGAVALLVTGPLWLGTAVLVKQSSPGPVLYRQLRVGTGGLPFQIHKFRTMYIDNDDSAQRLQNLRELRGEAAGAKNSDDPRITPVGHWLRRLSLDELPQLTNVFRSEMSLVGPRPSLLWESELFEPTTRRRLQAKPGVTGLWQISGRADVSMTEMLELDLDYMDQMGPMLDLRCLIGTVSSVAAGDGAR